jgi:dethiobiotin synthetase
MQQVIFVTGIGTDIGKTLVSAVITEALRADYWKPVQAGFDEGTDSEWVKAMLSNPKSVVHPEAYKLRLPASPHIAAREEGKRISLEKIGKDLTRIAKNNSRLVVEGAGGLMVPLNEKEFVPDLIAGLNAKVILVSQNYLGSINHSLLTAQVCKQKGLDVLGWVFNHHSTSTILDYENEIVQWTGFAKLGSIPKLETINKHIVTDIAAKLRDNLINALS